MNWAVHALRTRKARHEAQATRKAENDAAVRAAARDAHVAEGEAALATLQQEHVAALIWTP